MSQKGNALLILVIVLVLIFGIVGYVLYSRGYFSPTPSPSPVSNVFNYGSTPVATNPPALATNQEVGNVTSTNLPLTVTYPATNATLNSSSLTLTGKTAPNADVFVNDQTTKADANGNFSIKLNLDEGQNGLVVTANDANGNVAEQDLSVNVQTF